MQEIICVLDKSGSMQSVANDAVHGYNAFLKEQKEIGDANFTLIMFDNGFQVCYEGKLSAAEPLPSWPNGGMTALLDAIGKIFVHVKDRFTREKPEKVILAIMTDGLENASHEFTNETVANLIKEHQNKYGWEVIFLAADQDAWSVAQHWGIHQQNVANYASVNTVDGYQTLSKSVMRART